MLVFGDHSRMVAPRELILEVDRDLRAARSASGLERRDLHTGALITAGELLQGVADAELEATGEDDCTPTAATLMELAIAVARQLLADGESSPASPDTDTALAAVRRLSLPPRIRCKTPEGYAFYTVYPEDYAAAAAGACADAALVIGVRSIGTSLAAAAAARLGCAALTVRPCGHPFRRELRVSAALKARLARHAGTFVVVDEGPGFSGSSFGAVADLLESLGVSLARMVFVPSHAGELGSCASPAHRARWRRARRAVATNGVSARTVETWFAGVAGPVDRVEDLSGGTWRRELGENAWPPAAPVYERRKLRLTGPDGRLVARFAGLGAIGARKAQAAGLLYAAGFTPEPLALRRGFLLERWVEGERLPPSDGRAPGFLRHLGRYLGYRARALPAAPMQGGNLPDLRRMAAVNAAELGGPELGRLVDVLLAEVGDLSGLEPVLVDGRLHAWEWLRRPDGGFCKTDALDHAMAHDLVGCQDIAWDVAGAAVEFGLPEQAIGDLAVAVGDAAGRPVSAAAVAAFRICYAAFQAGSWSMTGEAGPRVEALRPRYLAELRRAVAAATSADRPAPAAPPRGRELPTS